MAAAPRSESEPRLRCWQCKKATPIAFFCQHCNAVQRLPSNTNYSNLLGFGGLPKIDRKVLEDRYYALSRKLHPDRFQTGTSEEQQASLQATALLNTAFQTLSDIEKCGRWWLEQEGESLGRGNSEVPAALAARVFEVQEKIAEFEAAGEASRSEARGELSEIRKELTSQLEEERTTVEKTLQTWGDTPEDRASARADLKQGLSKISYLHTLKRDVRRALED